MYTGKFITLEGPDGAGKSSVIQQMAERLKALGYTKVMMTREPGGNAIAEQIRKVILDVKSTTMDERTEALLYAAARRQHLVEKVLPALQEGYIVLCDRFVDSSLAYQGAGRNIDMNLIWQINHFAIEENLPDLTLLLDVPAEVGLMRIYENRSEETLDRLDLESVEFHHVVRNAFLELAHNTDRIEVVDATQPLTQVVEQCMTLLKEHQII